jgi:hypothetical protein
MSLSFYYINVPKEELLTQWDSARWTWSEHTTAE